MAARKKAAPPKRGATRYQEPAKSPVHPLVLVTIGLVIGVFIMSLVKLEPGKDSVKRATAQPATQQKAAQKPATKPEQPSQSANPNKPTFEFYTLLSESEGIVPPEALPEKAPPPPSQQEVEAKRKAEAARAQAILDGKQPPPAPPRKEVTQYYLQAGSFPEREKAEGVRARLLLTGQNVHIEPGQVANKTWHRVLVGPFASREELDKAQTRLSQSGFNNLLLQQRKARL